MVIGCDVWVRLSRPERRGVRGNSLTAHFLQTSVHPITQRPVGWPIQKNIEIKAGVPNFVLTAAVFGDKPKPPRSGNSIRSVPSVLLPHLFSSAPLTPFSELQALTDLLWGVLFSQRDSVKEKPRDNGHRKISLRHKQPSSRASSHLPPTCRSSASLQRCSPTITTPAITAALPPDREPQRGEG
uniref:Uncharacterized protein n=1 Tax=Knipowitschia caucasica TaxID=637954 RepID=A0AAV2LCR4_KNICA